MNEIWGVTGGNLRQCRDYNKRASICVCCRRWPDSPFDRRSKSFFWSCYSTKNRPNNFLPHIHIAGAHMC